MFGLSAQAAAIVAALESIEALGTVAYIDQDDQSGRFPATLPSAFVTIDRAGPGGSAPSPRTSLAALTWAVIVRGKKLDGPGGCLAIIDAVLDRLVGLHPATDVKPLQFEGIEYFGIQAESVSYIVRVGTIAAGRGR